MATRRRHLPVTDLTSLYQFLSNVANKWIIYRHGTPCCEVEYIRASRKVNSVRGLWQQGTEMIHITVVIKIVQ